MGNTIWADVQGRDERESPQDNSLMLRLASELDALSAKLGVARLSDFHDYGGLKEEFADFAGGDIEPGGTWFEPAAAAEALRAIRAHLREHPKALGVKLDPSRAHWPSALAEELAHCHAVLDAAVAGGKRFRFRIVS